MKIKQILSSAGIYGGRNLRALIIVAALAQLSFGQLVPLSRSATSLDFSISISPSEVVIPPGGTATYTITVTGPSISSGVAFSVTGIPPHSTDTISMESGSVYSLTIVTSRLTPQGEYVFTVTATSGGMSASASAKLIVLLSAS
ncbi:MAG TPA: hypothetical protein VKY85_20720 [Candidatus Angelobacter sp.]|nr:hypothetical protein [Candidatus Angelobacter sp.]